MSLETIIYDKDGLKVTEQPSLRRICITFGPELNYDFFKDLTVKGLTMGSALAKSMVEGEESNGP